MKIECVKKLIVSSLALSLILGGGALYGTKSVVRAKGADGAVPQQSAASPALEGEASVQPIGKGGIRQSAIVEEAAAVLGLDKQALEQELTTKTLAEIAKEKGISEQDLLAKLKAERTKRIDEAAAAGKLTADQAAKMKEHMDKHLQFMVSHKLGELRKDFHGRRGHGMLPAPDKLAAMLGMSENDLKAQLKAGKSLAEIAKAQGITKEQLVGKIKDELTPWIEKMVDRKRGDKPQDAAPNN